MAACRVAQAHVCQCLALGRGGGHLCRSALRRQCARSPTCGRVRGRPGKHGRIPGVTRLRAAAVAVVHCCERLPHTQQLCGDRLSLWPSRAISCRCSRAHSHARWLGHGLLCFSSLWAERLSSLPRGPHHVPLWVSSAHGIGLPHSRGFDRGRRGQVAVRSVAEP